MVLLKHLAQQFSADPRRLRAQLRKKFGKHTRWKWESDNDPELIQIRKYLSTIYGESTADSQPSISASPASRTLSRRITTSTERVFASIKPVIH